MNAKKPEEKFITVNKLRLRYLDWGTAGKFPLVCLHGNGSQAHVWDEFAEVMSNYYCVYAPDQRGHGGSQWASDGYERDKFVADLSFFLDDLALSRVVLAGLSMGGWNSLLYTAAHPERVERIILVDIAPEIGRAALEQMAERPPLPLEFDSFEEAFAWVRQGDPWATEVRLRKDVGDRMYRREDGKWVWKADLAGFSAAMRDTSDSQIIARYWRSLETITCPILEVRGKGSLIVSDDILERMRHASPHLSVVDVEGAGHSVPLDKPGEFIAATRAFLGMTQ